MSRTFSHACGGGRYVERQVAPAQLNTIWNRKGAVKELESLKRVFGELKKAPLTNFPAARGRINAPDAQGVYFIYSPRGKVLHVGRTPRGKKGLRQRLNNHLHAGSSFTLKYLDGHGARLRKGYQ